MNTLPRSALLRKAGMLFAVLMIGCSDDGGVGLAGDAGPITVPEQPSTGDPTDSPTNTIDPNEPPGPTGPVPGPNGEDVPLSADTLERLYVTALSDGSRVIVSLDDENRLLGLVRRPATAADSSWLPDKHERIRLLTFRTGADAASSAETWSWQSHDRLAGGEANVLDTPSLPVPGQTLEALAATDTPRIEPGSGITLELIDGQSQLAVPATSEDLADFSVSNLAGSWQSAAALCSSDPGDCNRWQLDVTVSVSGGASAGSFEGRSRLLSADGETLVSLPLEGTLLQHGLRAARLEFDWNTYRYEGYALVDNADPDSLTLLATTDSELADYRVLLLRLQPS